MNEVKKPDTKVVEIMALEILHRIVALDERSQLTDEDEGNGDDYVPHQSDELRNALGAARSLLKAREGKYGPNAPDFLR